MSGSVIKPGSIVRGPALPVRVEILALVPFGELLKLIGRGQYAGLTFDPVLNSSQFAQLQCRPSVKP